MREQFSETLGEYQTEIKKELEEFFDEKMKRTRQPFVKGILRLLKEFSLRPAKRIRPILINQGYLLAGGKNRREILKTSIFIELIHNFLLIHDDIIDEDKIRRGGPTIHHYYRGGHYGESMAIIVGDLANSLGYEILSSSRFPIKNKIRAIEKLNQVLYSTGYGQLLELCMEKKKRKSMEEILEVCRNKTANYTFVGPLQIGAILAGANRRFLGKIEKLAMPLGVAFQIKDDILDAKSDRQVYVSKHLRQLAERLIHQGKQAINREKTFPEKQKQFLLSLADFVLNRNV